MDFDALFGIILKVVGLIGAALVAYLLPALHKLLESNIGAEKTAYVQEVIRTLVISAETATRLTGEEKKAYVETQLEELGVEVTEYVRAMIEAAVFDTINFGMVKDCKVIDNSPAEAEVAE